ncbi:MAG TPA: CDP-alcohol phosphatidyltransferase family protein [Phycisphaerales bacterium]|nr:CDP-alcohol phosphatidyltransferase family protein [Phycisphaerales bacterium]
MHPPTPTDRRPLRSRSFPLFISLARALAARRVRPNAISVASTLCAVGGAVLLVLAFRVGTDLAGRVMLMGAGGLFMLRLLCNMLDGMVAVEGGLGTPAGELYNEVPDRVSDAAVLIGAGYAVNSCSALGYSAAILAVMTAYIRAVGKGAGAGSDFSGLMDKKRRMALVTLACAVLALSPRTIEPLFTIHGNPIGVWPVTLAVIAVGSLVTCLTRLRNIARRLRTSA